MFSREIKRFIIVSIYLELSEVFGINFRLFYLVSRMFFIIRKSFVVVEKRFDCGCGFVSIWCV